jgi:hypothetical protein
MGTTFIQCLKSIEFLLFNDKIKGKKIDNYFNTEEKKRRNNCRIDLNKA